MKHKNTFNRFHKSLLIMYRAYTIKKALLLVYPKRGWEVLFLFVFTVIAKKR